MRLWTIHPKYLDTRGLTAVWRDALLAQQALRGKTRGYESHPQLARFRAQAEPLATIATYLEAVAQEAEARGFDFGMDKIDPQRTTEKIPATQGQLVFEWGHLRAKLAFRDRGRFEESGRIRQPDPHPLFEILPGDVEPWETRKDR